MPVEGIECIACSGLPNMQTAVSVPGCQENSVRGELNLSDPFGVLFDLVEDFPTRQVEDFHHFGRSADCDERLIGRKIRCKNRVVFLAQGQYRLPVLRSHPATRPLFPPRPPLASTIFPFLLKDKDSMKPSGKGRMPSRRRVSVW